MLKKLLSVLMLAVTMLSLGSAFPFEASAADNGLHALSPDWVLAMQHIDQLKEAIAESKGPVDTAQPDATNTYVDSLKSYVKSKGTYNSTNGVYTITIKASNNSINLKCELRYWPSSDKFRFSYNLVNGSNDYEWSLEFFCDVLDTNSVYGTYMNGAVLVQMKDEFLLSTDEPDNIQFRITNNPNLSASTLNELKDFMSRSMPTIFSTWETNFCNPAYNGVLKDLTTRVTYVLDVEPFVEIPIGSSYKINYNVSPSGTKVTWDSSNPSIATVNSSGLVTAKKPFYAKITGTVGGSVSGTCEVFVEFLDVMDSNQFYFYPVYWAAEFGITSGFTDSHGNLTGYFKPNATCTRGQIATFMYRYFGQYFTVDTSDVPDFSDVKKGSYYYDAVKWAVAVGITTGYTDKNGKPTGKFGPEDPCTRAQVVTFIYRMLSDVWPADTSNVPDFSDVKKNTYYYDAVRWAVAQGITTGYSDSSGNPSGKFGPNDKCTRGQVVTFLYRT